MKVTKTLVGLAAVAAALTLTPMAGAQAGTPKLSSLSAACSPGGEVTHMLKASACPQPFLDKREYAPGEAIKIHMVREENCDTYGLFSEGFAGLANYTFGPSNGAYLLTGTAKAGSTPGTYQATFGCNGVTTVNQFTIKAAPGKPKPPITKPKGAADTGGGGTA